MNQIHLLEELKIALLQGEPLEDQVDISKLVESVSVGPLTREQTIAQLEAVKHLVHDALFEEQAQCDVDRSMLQRLLTRYHCLQPETMGLAIQQAYGQKIELQHKIALLDAVFRQFIRTNLPEPNNIPVQSVA